MIHRIRIKAQANSIPFTFIGGIFQDKGVSWLHAHLVLQSPLGASQQLTIQRLFDEVTGYRKDDKGFHLEPVKDLTAYLSYIFRKHPLRAQGWKMVHYRKDFLEDDVKSTFTDLQLKYRGEKHHGE